MPRDITFTQLQQPIRLKRKYHEAFSRQQFSRKRNEKLVFTKGLINGEENCELWYFAIIIANVYKETLHLIYYLLILNGCSLLFCWWQCNLR